MVNDQSTVLHYNVHFLGSLPKFKQNNEELICELHN